MMLEHFQVNRSNYKVKLTQELKLLQLLLLLLQLQLQLPLKKEL